MTAARRHPAILWLTLTLLIGQWGCATAPRRLSEHDRARLETIGVVSGRFIPATKLDVPAKGPAAGAGRGAATASVAMIGGGLQSGSPLGLIPIALSPLGATIGAIVGAVRAESAAKVEEAEATLRVALDAHGLQLAVRDRFPEVARGRTRHFFVALPDQPPTDGLATGPQQRESVWQDAILEITVFEVHLKAGSEAKINPPLMLMVSARTRLTVAGISEPYVQTFRYVSKKHKFIEWAESDGWRLREELDHAAESLGMQILDGVFLR